MPTTPTHPAQPPARAACPGCGSLALGDSFVLGQQPVILNYRFATAEAARAVARRDMLLRECNHCGLVFNAILDPAAIPYDERYENRQNFSAGFTAMLEETADLLTQRYPLHGGAVLEVGCGKGDFLTLLCERAQAHGVGFDTSCEQTGVQPDGRVSFFQRYVTPEDVDQKFDLVVCRHVVEHVPDIGEFFRLLHGVALAGGGSAVYVETPALEWIVEHHAFWDVFYEHCNYFPTRTLRTLAEQAGFALLDHRLIFGGQYQALELRPGAAAAERAPVTAHAGPMLASFAAKFAESRREVESKLDEAGVAVGWAIWGAGAKGVSLANALISHPPSFVIDSNPSKQGMFLPASGIPIIAPTDPKVAEAPVILVANSNYLAEIRAALAQQGIRPKLLTL